MRQIKLGNCVLRPERIKKLKPDCYNCPFFSVNRLQGIKTVIYQCTYQSNKGSYFIPDYPALTETTESIIKELIKAGVIKSGKSANLDTIRHFLADTYSKDRICPYKTLKYGEDN